MNFKNFILQAWKVMEFKLLAMENCGKSCYVWLIDYFRCQSWIEIETSNYKRTPEFVSIELT